MTNAIAWASPLNRRKMRIVAVQSLVVLVFTLCAVFGLVSLSNSMQPDRFVEVTVSYGDTLWEIASEFSSGKDIRSVIYDIKKYNQLQTAFVSAGQVLKVPLYN